MAYSIEATVGHIIRPDREGVNTNLGKSAQPLLPAQIPVSDPTSCNSRPATPATRHTRKAHRKVRTGCLTCKIRRKKCDEARPACNRCRSTGRHCDGYPTDVEELSTHILPDYKKVSSVGTSSHSIVLQRPHINLKPTAPNVQSRGIISYQKLRSTASAATTPSYLSSDVAASPGQEDVIIDDFIANYAPTNSASALMFSESKNVEKMPVRYISCVPTSISQTMVASDLELHCFSYFRHRTGPQFASYFDSSMWLNYCTNTALCHPVLLACATALGAVHRRFTYGISREAFEYCAHASRMQAKAQKMLDKLKGESFNQQLLDAEGGRTQSRVNDKGCTRGNELSVGAGLHDRDVIMASEMLLGLFEGFQSNLESALQHMRRGLIYMLDRPMKLTHSQLSYGPTESTSGAFLNLLQGMRSKALQLFDTPVCVLASRDADTALPPMPSTFLSLEEARDLIFTEVEWILSTPTSIWNNDAHKTTVQQLHVARLLSWGCAYADTIRYMQRSTQEKRACSLLKLVRVTAQFLLYLMLYVDIDTELDADTDTIELYPMSNSGWDDSSKLWPQIDEYTSKPKPQFALAQCALWKVVDKQDFLRSNLARIRLLAEAVLDENNAFHCVEHSVEFDSAMGPPQRGRQLHKSSSKTRHLIKNLKGRPIDDETFLETLGVYGVAERVSSIEEHAVLDIVKMVIPAHVKPSWVDVTSVMEERRLLLRYCHSDGSERGTVWTQEWWNY